MTEKTCIACGRGADQTPLLTLDYRESMFSICAQHLPVLIHDPAQLIGRLAGAEAMRPSEQED